MCKVRCDRTKCIYHGEHCNAKVLYYIDRQCMTYREHIVEPPPMVDRRIVHEEVPAGHKHGGKWGRNRVVRVWK